MTPPATRRDVALDALRTFLVLLVVAHHAALAYHPYAPRPAEPMSAVSRAWTAFPIVDAEPWHGIEVLVTFNDLFFMSLLFLISGVFASPGLARKGAARFMRDRLLRLGLPFVVAAAVLAPAAYYPTYLMSTPAPHDDFWQLWLGLDVWAAGPVWFLWVLLVFDAVFAGVSVVAPRSATAFGALSGRLSRRPPTYFVALVAASALAYLPLAAAAGSGRWVSLGPFWMQISRALHYAVYFFAGTGLGAYGLERGLLARDGALAQQWPIWLGAALAAFGLAGQTLLAILSTAAHGGPGRGLTTLSDVSFVLSCASSSFACLAVFLRFARTSNRVFDSLRANAYGIFLLHFVCVSWLQLGLLQTSLPSPAKALLVFAGAVAASWSVSAALRRIPLIASVL